MSKHKNPFGKGPSRPVPKSEEDTPPSGTKIPAGVVTPVGSGPELSGPPPVAVIEIKMLEKLQAQVASLTAQLEETKAIAKAQEADITTLTLEREDLAKAIGMTDADEKALFDICAEITFDRTRDGNSYVVKMKGRRSHTSGKIGRYPNFQALLQGLRERK